MREIIYQVLFRGIDAAEREFRDILRLVNELRDALAEIQVSDISLAKFEQQLRDASNGAITLDNALRSIEQTANRLNLQLAQSGAQINATFSGADEVTRLREELERTQTQLRELEQRLQGTQGETSEAVRSLQALEEALRQARQQAQAGDLVDVDVIANLRRQINLLNKALLAFGDTDGEAAGRLNAQIEQLRQQLERAQAVAKNGLFERGSLPDLQLQLQRVQRELKNTSEESENFAPLQRRFEGLRASIAAINSGDNLKVLRAELKALNNELIGLGSEGAPERVQALGREIEKVRQQIEVAQAQAKRGVFDEDSLVADRLQLQRLTRELDTIPQGTRRFRELTSEVNRLSVSLQAAERASGRFQRNVGNYPSLLSGVTQGFRRIGAAVLTAFSVQEVIFRTRDAIESVLQTTVDFSGEISRAVSLAQSTISELDDIGANFDIPFQNATVALDAVNAQLDLAAEKARNFAAVSNFTAQEVGETFTQLGRSGFGLDQIFQVTPESQAFALAAGEDLTKSTDVLISALRTFNTEAELNAGAQELAADATNIFTGALTSANIDLEQFNEAFKQIAPTASQFDQDLASVSNTIAELGNRNLRGTIATTSLRTSFNRLVGDIPAVTREIQKLNVDFETQEGQLKPLPEIIRTLNEAYADYTPAARAASLSVLVGNRAINQFNVLLEVGADELERGEARLRGYTANVDELRASLAGLETNQQALADLADIGVDVQFNIDDTVNVRDLVRQLDGVFDTLDEATRFDLISNLFGGENADLIVSELAKGEGAADGLAEALDRAARSGKTLVEEIGAIQLDSLENQIALVRSAVEEFSLTLGDILEPAFRDALTETRFFVTAFSEALKGTTDVEVLPEFQEALRRGVFQEGDFEQINAFIAAINSTQEALGNLLNIVKVLGPAFAIYRGALLQSRLENIAATKGVDSLTRSQRVQLQVLRRLRAGTNAAVAPIRFLGQTARGAALGFRTASVSGNLFQQSLQRVRGAAIGATVPLRRLGRTVRTSVTGAFRSLGRAIAANPLFIIVGVIGLAVEALQNLAERTDETGAKARQFLDTLSAVGNFLTTVFVDSVGVAVNAISALFNVLTFDLEQAGNDFNNAINGFSNSAKALDEISLAPLRKELERSQEAFNALSEGEFSVTALEERLTQQFDVTTLAEVDSDELKAAFEELGQEILDVADGTFRQQLDELATPIVLNAEDLFNAEEALARENLADAQAGSFFGGVSDAEVEAAQIALDEILDNRKRFGAEFEKQLLAERTQVEANIRVLLQQTEAQKELADLGDFEPPTLDPGAGDDALRDLELQADRILQRLESVGDRANERLEARFLEDLVTREEFQRLTIERQVALVQDGLNRINETRRQARQEDIDEERVYLNRQLTQLRQSLDERSILSQANFFSRTDALREQLENEEITQAEFNARFAQQELDLADELAGIRSDSLADRLEIIAGENSEIINRVPQIREQLAQEREARRREGQAVLDETLRQQGNLEFALERNFARREEIERQFTENLIQIERDRTEQLQDVATANGVSPATDQISTVINDRINNLQIAYQREEELLNERESFLDLRANRLNVERINTEREFNESLAALNSERVDTLRRLRVEDADLGVINATVAQFDTREDNLTETYTRQLEIIERQGNQVTAAITRVEGDQLNALTAFNDRRLELQRSLNDALTGILSETEVDGGQLASTFIERSEVVSDGFAAEVDQIEQQSLTLVATLQRLNQSRIDLEERHTQDIAGIGVERNQAVADLNDGFISQADFDTLETGLNNRQALIERVFEQDIERIEQTSLATESALADAYRRRNEIDAEFYSQILAQQQQFTDNLTEFNVDIAPSVTANPATLAAVEAIFDERKVVLEEALATELELLTSQNDLINEQLVAAVDLRDRTDVIFSDQIDALTAFQAEVEALAGVSFDIQGPNVGEANEADLSVLQELADNRRAIIEDSQRQEEEILSRREGVLLDAVATTDLAVADVQERTAESLSALIETQDAILSQVGTRVDLTQFEAYFERRNAIVSAGFEREITLLNARATDVRNALEEVTAAQLTITEQSRVDLLAIDAQFQREFAQAVAEGATDQQLELIRSQTDSQIEEVRASYQGRLEVLEQQEANYLSILQNFSQQRTQAENNFFEQSAQNFQRGTQLLASTLGADNDFLIDFSIDATFSEDLDQISRQLVRVNNEINEAQVERLANDATFTDAQRQILNQRIADLQGQRVRLSQEQFDIIEQFNEGIGDQQEAFIRTLGENLEGEDLFSGLAASLEAEVAILDDAYSAANNLVQQRLDERLAIQEAIDQRERDLIEGRRVNLENQARLESALLGRIASQVELPDIGLNLGELVDLTSDIEGLDAFEDQIRQVIAAGQAIANTFEDETDSLAQESAENRSAIDDLRSEQVGAYEDYLSSLEAVALRREVIFDDLVVEGVIPERVAEIQREADALIALQAEVRELESARNEAVLEANQEALIEAEAQLAVARDALNRTATEVNGAILAELVTDYEETLRFVSRLNTQLVTEINEARDAAIDDAQGVLTSALTTVDPDLLDDDIFASLVDGAERAGAQVLESLDLSAFDLNEDQLNALSAALDLYREQAISANEAQSAGLKQAAKDAQSLLAELQKLVEADITRESQTAQADVEFELNSDLNTIAQDALEELRRFSQDEERINNERRSKEIIAEAEAQREITRIREEEIQKRLDQVPEGSQAAEDLNRELREIRQSLETDEVGFFEELQEITQSLTTRELADLREELQGVIGDIDDPAVRARLEAALEATGAQVVNTTQNVADNLKTVAQSVSQLADILNDAFQIDENLQNSDAAIDNLLSQQEEIDKSYLSQIETLERLIGVQEEGTASSDARNLSQRLAATGATQALEDELDAIRVRYQTEQDILDERLEQEQARNDEYQAQARALQIAQTTASLASAVASSIAAVAKFSETTAITGPAAFALIPAFVAVLGAAVATVKSLFAEEGGRVSVINNYEYGGAVTMMREGGLRSNTKRVRSQRMISSTRKVRKVKRGTVLKGRSHKSGGILTELEGNEFVSSVPTVKMFEPQLQWMNEQGNMAREGKPFSREFPVNLFPTTQSTTPHVPQRVVSGFARDGGRVGESGGDSLDNEMLEGIMTLLEDQNQILTDLGVAIPAQRVVLPVNQLNRVQDVLIEAERREFE